MLIIQTGNCEKCKKAFGQIDTVQSTNVECKKCKKKFIVCMSCKEKGCECKGKLLNVFDTHPDWMW